MIRCLAVVAPGTSLPVGLQSAASLSKWHTSIIEWNPKNRVRCSLRGVEVVVLAGWGADDCPHELSQTLAEECQQSMDVARFPVVAIHESVIDQLLPEKEMAPLLEWHSTSSNGAGMAQCIERLALGLRRRRRGAFLMTVVASVVLLLLTSVLGAGLLTLWAAGYDPALQEALVLLDGLEGPKPRFLKGDSLSAWHDRLRSLEEWQPVSLASHEMETRVEAARALLGSWIEPLDFAARWPEVEDSGSLERLRRLASSIQDFNPQLSGFADSPLGNQALNQRDEIVAAVRDADLHISETHKRMEIRRELLALVRPRTPVGVDWSGWYHVSEGLLQETMLVLPDAPVRELVELREAHLAELESLADLQRARHMVNLLGLAGPGPAYLVPPAGGATLALAAERLDAVVRADPHSLADLVAAGLPGAFVNGISSAVEAARNAWLAGGGKELVARLKPEGTGIDAWRTALESVKSQSEVVGWNQLARLLEGMERAGPTSPIVPPLTELQHYFATMGKPILPTAAIVEMAEVPEGEIMMFLINERFPDLKVVLKSKIRERKASGWIVALRPVENVPLNWAVGDVCTARLMVGDTELAAWAAPSTVAVGTEGIWGLSSTGLRARLRWDPAGAVPEPPVWWNMRVR